MARNLEQELQAWDGEWPEAWKPAEGEILVGRILRYGEGMSAFGPVRTAIVERRDGSRTSVWMSSTVLLAEFQRLKPKVGEEVGVRYLGKHRSKGYKRYTVLVNRDEGDPEFSPLGGERGGDAGEEEAGAAITAAVRPAPSQRPAPARDVADPFAEEDAPPPTDRDLPYATDRMQPTSARHRR